MPVNSSPDCLSSITAHRCLQDVLGVSPWRRHSSVNHLLHSLLRTPCLPKLCASSVPTALDTRGRFHLSVRSAPVNILRCSCNHSFSFLLRGCLWHQLSHQPFTKVWVWETYVANLQKAKAQWYSGSFLSGTEAPETGMLMTDCRWVSHWITAFKSNVKCVLWKVYVQFRQTSFMRWDGFKILPGEDSSWGGAGLG